MRKGRNYKKIKLEKNGNFRKIENLKICRKNINLNKIFNWMENFYNLKKIET